MAAKSSLQSGVRTRTVTAAPSLSPQEEQVVRMTHAQTLRTHEPLALKSDDPDVLSELFKLEAQLIERVQASTRPGDAKGVKAKIVSALKKRRKA